MLDFVDLTIHVTLFVSVTFWLLELVINWYLELKIEFTKESVQRIFHIYGHYLYILKKLWAQLDILQHWYRDCCLLEITWSCFALACTILSQVVKTSTPYYKGVSSWDFSLTDKSWRLYQLLV